jgi:hypothetical protein
MIIPPIILKEYGKKILLFALQILLAELLSRKAKARKK